MRRLAAAALLLGSVPAVPATADALLGRLRSESAHAAPRPFERTLTRTVAGKPGRVTVDRFDPAAPAGRQWTLLSVDGHAPTAADADAHRKETSAQPVPGFHRLHLLLAGAASRHDDAAGAHYHWEHLAPGALGTRGPDISAKLSADADIADVHGVPTITSVRVYAARPFSVMLVARIRSLENVSTYRRGLDGAPVLVQQTSRTDASIPFRQDGVVETRAEFRPVSPIESQQ